MGRGWGGVTSDTNTGVADTPLPVPPIEGEG